jgi:hypothetical protein
VKEFLQGRRFGFAPRAQLGGIALGFGLAATLLDLMAWFQWGARDTNGFVVAAQWLVVATAVVALLAALAAFAETRDLAEEDTQLGRLDLVAAALATVLYAASAALRTGELNAAGASPAPLLLALGGLVVLLVDAVVSSNLYAAREWEELDEEITPVRHRRRRAAAR